MLPIASASTPANIVAWALQGLGAGAMVLMGAIPKFTGQFPSPQLFEMMGVPDFTRFAVGTVELLTAILLLIPKTRAYGGVLLILAMLGAIAAHALTPLGFMPEFTDPATQETLQPPLIFMAIGLLLVGVAIVILRRNELPWKAQDLADVASSVVDDVI